MRPLYRTLPALLATLALTNAHAQFGGSMGGGMGGGMGDGPPGGGRGPRSESQGKANERHEMPDPASPEQIAYQLDLLEDELQLAPPQQGLWQNFKARSLAYARDVQRERNRGLRIAQGRPQPGAAYLNQVLDTARNRLTALEDVDDATRRLYQALTPPQATALDTRLPYIIEPRGMPPGGPGAPGGKPPAPKP